MFIFSEATCTWLNEQWMVVNVSWRREWSGTKPSQKIVLLIDTSTDGWSVSAGLGFGRHDHRRRLAAAENSGQRAFAFFVSDISCEEFSWWRSGTRSNTNDAVQAPLSLLATWKASRLSVWSCVYHECFCGMLSLTKSCLSCVVARLSGAGVRPKKSVGDMIGWELKQLHGAHGRWKRPRTESLQLHHWTFVIATSLHIIYRRFDIWLMNH